MKELLFTPILRNSLHDKTLAAAYHRRDVRNRLHNGRTKQKNAPQSDAFFPKSQCSVSTFLADTSFFTCKFTQIIEFGTTYLTATVHRNRVDKRRIQRENTLNAYVARHFTNCKASFVAMTRNANYITTEILHTLFVSFANTVCNRDVVTALEGGMLFFFRRSHSFFHNLDKIHFYSY